MSILKLPLFRGHKLAAAYFELQFGMKSLFRAREAMSSGREPLVYTRDLERTLAISMIQQTIQLRREVLDRFRAGETYSEFIERCSTESNLSFRDVQWLAAGATKMRVLALADMVQVISDRDPTRTYAEHYVDAVLRELNSVFERWKHEISHQPSVRDYLSSHWFAIIARTDGAWGIEARPPASQDVLIPSWERARLCSLQLIDNDIEMWEAPPLVSAA